MASGQVDTGAGAEAGGSSGGSANSSVGTSRRQKNLPKNAAGQRQDVGSLHGVSVDRNPRKIKCNYCEGVYTGGVYRFKHHLAGTRKDVEECKAAPEQVRKQMCEILCSPNKKTTSRDEEQDIRNIGDFIDEDEKRKRVEGENAASIFKKRGMSSQTTLKKGLKEKVDLQVARFFVHNDIDPKVANNKEFQKMCDLISHFGPGYKVPSENDIRDKIMKGWMSAWKKIQGDEHENEITDDMGNLLRDMIWSD